MISLLLNQSDRDLLLQLMNESINGIGLHGIENSRKNEYYCLFSKIKHATDVFENNFHLSITDLKIIEDTIFRSFQWLTFDFSIRVGIPKREVIKWIEKINAQTKSHKVEFCNVTRLNMDE